MSEENIRDKILIDKVKLGDRSAFRKLFDLYYQFLLSTAINLLKDINLAKDVVQEVFFEIWKKRESLNVHSTVAGYLKRAIINRSLNQIKSRKKVNPDHDFHDLESTQPSVTEELESKHLNKVLQDALNELPERCRLVFIMRRFEDLSHKEIAEKLDISTKTVENQMTKALKVLKTAIQPYVQKKIE